MESNIHSALNDQKSSLIYTKLANLLSKENDVCLSSWILPLSNSVLSRRQDSLGPHWQSEYLAKPWPPLRSLAFVRPTERATLSVQIADENIEKKKKKKRKRKTKLSLYTLRGFTVPVSPLHPGNTGLRLGIPVLWFRVYVGTKLLQFGFIQGTVSACSSSYCFFFFFAFSVNYTYKG